MRVVSFALFLAATSAHAAGVHYVYVVRHGAYDRDPSARDDRAHNGLNAVGHEQARLVGVRLASLPVHVDHLVSSEFLRAKETADDIGKVLHMTAVRDATLNECHPGSDAACDAARVTEWTKYFAATPDKDTVDVIVTHGNVIRWTLLRALNADTKAWPSLDLANGSISVFAVEASGEVHVVTYDDVGHLPVELQTWLGTGVGVTARATAR
jgi:broad specificity phosphatase PhoE